MLQSTIGWVLVVLSITQIYCEWLDDCLDAHNEFRAAEGKPPMKINQTLCAFAKKRAQELSRDCAFDHNGNKDSGFGENLAAGQSSCRDTVKQWTDEKPKYDRKNPGFKPGSGHYTQIVWKNSADLCCAMESHCKYRHVTVCNYWKPGNVNTKEQFESNV